MQIQTDPLDAALASLSPRGAFIVRAELAAPWGFVASVGIASFHLVEVGRCVLGVEGTPLAELEAGDFAVIPHGHDVSFRDTQETPLVPLDTLQAMYPPGADGVLRMPPGGDPTTLVCGGVAFADTIAHPIFASLPDVLVIRGATTEGDPWLRDTLRFLASESKSGRAGAATVMGHLGSVLFVQAVRQCVAEGASGWLGALADPHLGPALRALHDAPEAGWTVEALGRIAGLGRSAFAARFREAVGEPPMQHVARWRAHRAAELLRAGATLTEAASGVGYESDAAFGRAFKRWTGRSPGSLRRAA